MACDFPIEYERRYCGHVIYKLLFYWVPVLYHAPLSIAFYITFSVPPGAGTIGFFLYSHCLHLLDVFDHLCS